MLTPASHDFAVYSGGTFETTIRLWKDLARTEPFDLTGYTVELVIDGVLTLTSGAGLTVTAAEGRILVVMSPAQTSPVPLGRGTHYRLSLTREGIVTFPIAGQMDFRLP